MAVLNPHSKHSHYMHAILLQTCSPELSTPISVVSTHMEGHQLTPEVKKPKVKVTWVTKCDAGMGMTA